MAKAFQKSNRGEIVAVVVKCDWGLHKLVRGKEIAYGSQYLYAGVPRDQVGKYWWGDDLASARQFDSLEQAQEFVNKVWQPTNINQTFQYVDGKTKEVIATDARDDAPIHATEKSEGRSDSPVTPEG